MSDDDVKIDTNIDAKAEERRELARLITMSMGGHENQIDGRVAEAVNHIEDCDGIKAWSKDLAHQVEAESKKWYKSKTLWIRYAIICMMFISLGWAIMNISYAKNTSSLAPLTNHMGAASVAIDHLHLKREAKTMNDADTWLIDENTFHPLTGQYPFDQTVSEEYIKQNAAEYVYQNEIHYELPGNEKELLEIGDAVDADNPWYLYQSAAYLVKNAGLKSATARKSKPASSKYNEVMVQEAWELLEKADQLGTLSQHRDRLQQRKQVITSNSVPRDYLGFLGYIAYSAGYGCNDIINYLTVDYAFVAKFETLAIEGSIEEVQHWLGIYKRYIASVTHAQETLVGTLVVSAILKEYEATVTGALSRVGLDTELDQAQLLTKLRKEDENALNAIMTKRHATNTKQHKHGIISSLANSSSMPIGPASNAHIYNRNAEHAFITQPFCLFAAILLFFTFIYMSSYGLTRGKVSRFSGTAMTAMLGAKDWLIILLGGMILPIIIYYITNHSDVLGARQWSVRAGSGASFLFQFISLFLLQITTSYCLIRWRLSVRSQGIVKSVNKPAYFTAIVALALMLLSGLCGKDGMNMNWIGYLCIACILIVILSMLYRSLRGFCKQQDVIAVAGINRCMTLILSLGIICAIAMIPCYYAEEKKWIQNDPEFTFSPDVFGYSIQEHKSTIFYKNQLTKRLKTIK